MTEENKKIALAYNAQARYFLEAAMLASKHAEANRISNPLIFNNFEAVIVGTHHSFAAEILIKGIINYYTGSHPKKHKIDSLLDHDACAEIREFINANFNKEQHTSFVKEEFESILDNYVMSLNRDDKFDKKEIESIKLIREGLEFGSFRYFLELHSNHFVKMRYACEKPPPPLDMNFTSFLNAQLRNELENNLLKLENYSN